MSDCTQQFDAVWVVYPAENLKELTQQKSGNGAGVQVENGSAPIPKELWNFVFFNEDNKIELFVFISKELSGTNMNGRLLTATYLETVLSTRHQSHNI